jgi:hypothetical protein
MDKVYTWRRGRGRSLLEERWSLQMAGRLYMGLLELLSFSFLQHLRSKGLMLPPLSMARRVASPCSTPNVARAISSSVWGSFSALERHWCPRTTKWSRPQLVQGGAALKHFIAGGKFGFDCIFQSLLGCYMQKCRSGCNFPFIVGPPCNFTPTSEMKLQVF